MVGSRGETVFQVTNSGLSVIVLERWDVRRGCRRMGTNVLLSAGVVAAVLGLNEVEDEDAGVEEPEEEFRDPDRRWRMGLRGAGSECLVTSGSEASSSSSRVDSVASSSRPLGYASQAVWTWYSVIGVRFSRLAERASKQ